MCSSFTQVLAELKEYATEVDVDFVRKAVRAIGRCAIKVEVWAIFWKTTAWRFYDFFCHWMYSQFDDVTAVLQGDIKPIPDSRMIRWRIRHCHRDPRFFVVNLPQIQRDVPNFTDRKFLTNTGQDECLWICSCE